MDTDTILIVDDESLTRRALLSGVHWDELGISRVLEAGSAAAAKDILKKEKVDLALIDVEMPGETGIQLLEWIRRELGESLTCAFLTCHASFDYAQHALRLGSFDYVLKPVDFEEVENLILRMVGRTRKVRETQQIASYGRQWLQERVDEGHKYEKSGSSAKEIVDQSAAYIRSHLSEKLSLSTLAGSSGDFAQRCSAVLMKNALSRSDVCFERKTRNGSAALAIASGSSQYPCVAAGAPPGACAPAFVPAACCTAAGWQAASSVLAISHDSLATGAMM